MLSLYRTLSWRYLQRHWIRTALVIATIALGVSAWVATSALNQSMEKAIRASATPLGGAAHLHVSNNEAGVDLTLAEALSRVPGVAEAQPLIIERVFLPDLDNQSAMLIGVPLERGADSASTWGVTISDGTMVNYLFARAKLQTPTIVGLALDKTLPCDDQNRFTIRAGVRQVQVTRVGTMDASGPAASLGGSMLLMDIDSAIRLLERPKNMATRIDLVLQTGADLEQVRQRVQAEVGDALEVLTPTEHDERIRAVLIGLEIGFSICGACALVVGMFLIYNALAVSVAERRHDIGILRALGATREQVRRLFLGEAILLGITGIGLGIPVGLGLAHFSLGPVQNVLRDIFLPVQAREIEITALTIISALVAGLGTTMLAALVPAVRAASEEPADAVRRVPALPGLLYRVVHLSSCLTLAGLGVLAVALKAHLPERWGTYMALILIFPAALLLTPLLAAIVARALQPATRRLLGISGRLAADNLIRSPGRTGLVIAALAAVVALMVQTSGVIHSNEDAILRWVDDSITANCFVTSGGPISASGRLQPMSQRVVQHLQEEFPDARFVPMRLQYPVFQHRDGREAMVYLVALDSRAYYDANKERHSPVPGLEQFLDLSEPGTAIVSSNFEAMWGLGKGDEITVKGAKGPVKLRVVGTIVDYSWNRGTIIVDRAHHVEDFDTALSSSFEVYLPVNTSAAVKEDFRKRVQQSPWGTDNALVVLTQDELKDEITGMIHRLYGLAYSQEIVVAIVAALGVVMALLISVLQRRRELGLLRAVGATQAQILRTVIAEAALMGMIGALIGLLVSVPLEWYIVRVVLFEEAGFLFPVLFPWKEAAGIAVLALFIATLAGLLPAMHAMRLRIAEAIAYE